MINELVERTFVKQCSIFPEYILLSCLLKNYKFHCIVNSCGFVCFVSDMEKGIYTEPYAVKNTVYPTNARLCRWLAQTNGVINNA